MLLTCLVIAALIAVNALYVAAEFAAVAVERSRVAALAEGGSGRAAALMALLEDGIALDRYIAACQVGITLSSLAAGAFGQASLARQLAPLLEETAGLAPVSAQSAAAVGVLLVLTTLQVVLGELVPKSLALQFPERAALATFLPTQSSVSLLRGFIWLLNGSALLLLRPFGVSAGGNPHVHSPQEIQMLLEESRRGGALSEADHRRLQRGLQLSRRTVRQLMVPRSEIRALEIGASSDETLAQILDSPYSHLPVYRGSLDQIQGTVSAKEVARALATRGAVPPLSELLHPIPFVPEDLRPHRLVRLLQDRRSSKAIVVDEFGGVRGLVTIEDVLGELLGDVGDELKPPDPSPEVEADGSLRVPGTLPMSEVPRWLGVHWESSAATLGGHIVAHLGRLPRTGEQLDIDGTSLTIAEMTPAMVRWIRVAPPEPRLPAAREGEG